MNKFAIIGSGLAGISTARALIKRGIKPVLFDVGKTLDDERQKIVDRLGQQDKSNWDTHDIDIVTDNPTVLKKNEIPKKLSFGSDYIYERGHASTPVNGNPPITYAKGGFSTSWGGIIMPTDDCDMSDWPIKRNDLEPFYKKVLKGLPFSGVHDSLEKKFPLYHTNPTPLNLSPGGKSLLDNINNSGLMDEEDFLFGQTRILIQVSDEIEKKGCSYCGYCMSGCVYKCIYRAAYNLDDLIKSRNIEYRPNSLVLSLKESGNKVDITVENPDFVKNTYSFDRLFLAAGAVNSTRIVLESKNLFDYPVTMKHATGFILPMLNLKANNLVWPNINTEPGLVIEFKKKDISDHWIHSQISTPNELVLKKFNYYPQTNSIRNKISKPIFDRMIITATNIHSDHGGYRDFILKHGNKGSPSIFESKFYFPSESVKYVKQISKYLQKLCFKFGWCALTPFMIDDKKGASAWHFGGSLPMKSTPNKENETNLLGNPKGWSRIHVVDSSILPSIPGTTIGLPAMANASRIASEVPLD